MVLAKEVLFIDELNNLSDEDKPKLQEGMESQSITINKANIHIKMKVTSGIISAANPSGGHFSLDGEKTMEQQFNITTPILNRFDTIFVMMDNIDEESDSKIAAKMIKRHQGKLSMQFDKDFLRKFFTYIRASEEPIITEECGNLMNKAYCLARKNNQGRVKLNARFLNGLTRMVIASAKLRQSKEVAKKDIERAIEILAESEFKVNPYIVNKL
jgi:DNA replicative helicase MCM subunit Mcm2 (Cdc46/Mcm family)